MNSPAVIAWTLVVCLVGSCIATPMRDARNANQLEQLKELEGLEALGALEKLAQQHGGRLARQGPLDMLAPVTGLLGGLLGRKKRTAEDFDQEYDARDYAE